MTLPKHAEQLADHVVQAGEEKLVRKPGDKQPGSELDEDHPRRDAGSRERDYQEGD